MPQLVEAPQGNAPRATNRVTLEPFSRQMAVRANSYNPETRTFEVVFSTGAEGRRYGWAPTGQWLDQWIEELGMEPENVDLSRLNNGAPLCDSHYWWDLHGSGGNLGVIGVVEQARLEPGQGIARVRLSGRDDVAPIARDVQDGVLRKTSMGYEVTEWEETTTPEDARANTRRFKAVRWAPFEISLVAVPFDDGAGVRSRAATRRYESLVHFAAKPAGATRQIREGTMPPDTTTTPETPAPDAARAAATPPNAAAVPAAEVEARAAALPALRAHVRRNNLGQEFEDRLTDDVTAGRATVEVANQRILDALAARSAETPIASGIRVLPDQPDTATRDAVSAALMQRHAPQRAELPAAARRFAGRSLLEICRKLLELRGIRAEEFGPSELANRAMSSSDFPYITADVANKVLRAAYASQQRTFLPFCRRATLKDFKLKYSVKLGELPSLVEVPVGGEIKLGSMAEARESYRLRTYAAKIAMTREMLVNDDLDAFTRMATGFGVRAVILENDIMWALLLASAGAGAVMSDTKTVFHADHGNVISGASSALGVTGLSLLRQKARKQTGTDGKTQLNVAIKHLAVPTDLETKAEQLTTRTNVAKDADVNPFVSAFESVTVEPRMDAVSATAFIGAADPNAIDTAEYAYLEGNDGVRVETQEGWNTLGVEIRAIHDFGGGVIDHRGFYRSAGA